MRRYAVLGATVALAFSLRVFYLNERGLWYDEAFAILYASRSFTEMIAGTLTQVGGAAADVHPLFYYFSLHLWMQFAGDSAYAARFYSACFGVATIPIIYCLAHDLFDHRVGAVSALVVALAPFHLAYSQEARMYAQLGFWSALALLAFVRYSRAEQRRWWVVFVGAGACALYSHNLAFVSFVALGMWVLADAMRARSVRLLRATVFAGATMLALWLPWLVFVPSQFGKIEQAYWVTAPSFVTLFQTLLAFAFDFDNAAVPPALFPILLFGAAILPVLIALEIGRRGRATSRASLALAATLAILPVALLFVLSQWRPVYIIRALMPAFLWYALLVGWMLTGMPVLVRRMVAAALILVVGAVLPAYYTYAEFPRSPFQQMVQMVRARMQSGDVIVHDNKISFFPAYYYDRALDQSFIADPVGAGSDTLALPTQRALQLYAVTLDEATSGKSRVWFVIFQSALDQAQEEGHVHSNLAWMEQNFRRVSLERLNDLDVYLFER